MENEKCEEEVKRKGKTVCPQCNCEVDINKLDSLRCPRCFAILLAKCEECQKCKS